MGRDGRKGGHWAHADTQKLSTGVNPMGRPKDKDMDRLGHAI